MNEPYIGQIQLVPYQRYAPQDWMWCEGQMLNVAQHQALFSLIGNTFGGDGRLTFGLPNLKGKEPVPGVRYCISLAGSYPMPPD